MGEFFNGWRRKVGVVTLVLASVFAAGWVRSRSNVDLIWVYGTNPNLVFISGGEQFLILSGNGFTIVEHTLQKSVSITLIPEKPILPSGWGSNQTWLEPKSNVISEFREKPKSFNLIPYWSIVVPLTLISIWLLIFKPRKSTQTRITQPAPSEEANS